MRTFLSFLGPCGSLLGCKIEKKISMGKMSMEMIFKYTISTKMYKKGRKPKGHYFSPENYFICTFSFRVLCVLTTDSHDSASISLFRIADQNSLVSDSSSFPCGARIFHPSVLQIQHFRARLVDWYWESTYFWNSLQAERSHRWEKSYFTKDHNWPVPVD